MELKKGVDFNYFAQLPLRVLALEMLVSKIKLKLVLKPVSQILQHSLVIYRVKQLLDAMVTSTDLIMKIM